MSRSLGEPGHPGQTDANGESHWKDIGIRKPWGTVMRWKTSSPGPGSKLCAMPPPKWGAPGADGKAPSAKKGPVRKGAFVGMTSVVEGCREIGDPARLNCIDNLGDDPVLEHWLGKVEKVVHDDPSPGC